MKKIFNFIKRNKYYILSIILICIVAIGVRIPNLSYISDDIESYITPWFNELAKNGGLYGLKDPMGDYNLPYVTILALFTYLPFEIVYKVKMLSIFFDFVQAFGILWLTYLILKDNKRRKLLAVIAFTIALFLPTVILNSSLWGQADSIYTAFIVLSLCFLVKEKNFWSFVMLGISFAFKLQAIFVLPLFLIYYMTHEKFKWYYFLIIPAVDVLLCTPALMYGAPAASIIGIYMYQTIEYSMNLSMNIPNLYFLRSLISTGNTIAANSSLDIMLSVASTGFIFFILLVFTYKDRKNAQKSDSFILDLAVYSIAICTFFLPCMHERYIYPLIVCLLPFVIYNLKKRLLLIIIMEMISAFSYINYFTYYEYSQYLGISSYLFLSVIIAITIYYYKKYIKTDED